MNVQYVLISLACLNLIGLLSKQKVTSVILFCISYLLTTHYTNINNSIVVAIIISNLFSNKYIEGFDSVEENGDEDEAEEDEAKVEDTDGANDGANNKETDEANIEEDEGEISIPGLEELPGVSDETKVFEDSDDKTLGKRIDYSSTLEDAYANLQNILGKGGIKNLTEQTQHLLGQQKSLMDSLANMKPMINNAQDTLKNLNLEGITDMFNKKDV